MHDEAVKQAADKEKIMTPVVPLSEHATRRLKTRFPIERDVLGAYARSDKEKALNSANTCKTDVSEMPPVTQANPKRSRAELARLGFK